MSLNNNLEFNNLFKIPFLRSSSSSNNLRGTHHNVVCQQQQQEHVGNTVLRA